MNRPLAEAARVQLAMERGWLPDDRDVGALIDWAQFGCDGVREATESAPSGE